jgi:hypothetical protein
MADTAHPVPAAAVHHNGNPHEKPITERNEDADSIFQGATKVTHTDGFTDYVDNHAIGGDIHDMPKGYYRSVSFIMSFIAICFGSICAYLGKNTCFYMENDRLMMS